VAESAPTVRARALAEALSAGDRRALARALTAVESDPAQGEALLAALPRRARRARRVGVTGPPGAGKSTLVSALAACWRREGRRVGILAIDPSSPFTGGALLGDRIRMGAHHGDEGVFIRSLASRGARGGLADAAEDAADVLEAAGFDPVVFETVGVGQGEIDVAGAADATVVVLAPGAGDDVQALKAGLLEVADVLVVNQADRPEAGRLHEALDAGLRLRSAPAPPLLDTVATTGQGVEAVAAAVDRRLETLDDAGLALARARRRVRSAVDRARAERFWRGAKARLEALAREVVEGRTTVRAAARGLAEEEGR
jgi:LAO/AO transport system kinase